MSKETNMALFNTFGFKGLELRDYFAAKAMQAYFSDVKVSWDSESLAAASKQSYELADAMLAYRNKGKK